MKHISRRSLLVGTAAVGVVAGLPAISAPIPDEDPRKAEFLAHINKYFEQS